MGTREVLKPLVLPVYIPTLTQSTGMTAMVPIIPLIALRLGFSVSQAAAVTLIGGVLGVIGPVPVGRFMSRVGSRRALIAAGIVQITTSAIAFVTVGHGITHSPELGHRIAFLTILTVLAATDQFWIIGRQSYLGAHLPPQYRARGMSIFGGMFRTGQIIGPAAGAAAVAAGDLNWVYGLHALGMIAATLLVTFGMLSGDDAQRLADRQTPDSQPPDRGLIVRAALATVPLGIGRLARPLILPLLGAQMGVDAATISLVFAIGAVIELLMFLPAGALMDSYGRAAVLVPCLAIMGGGYVFMAVLVWTMPGNDHAVFILTAATVAIAFGNGFGAGIVMTIGIDISPESGRTRHLAAWNAAQGFGRLLAPALVSGITLFSTLAMAGMVTGGMSLAAAAWAAHVIPRVTPRPPRGPFKHLGMPLETARMNPVQDTDRSGDAPDETDRGG